MTNEMIVREEGNSTSELVEVSVCLRQIGGGGTVTKKGLNQVKRGKSPYSVCLSL